MINAGIIKAYVMHNNNSQVKMLNNTPMVNSQWSVVSGQWSVVSGQWSVVSG